MITATMRQLRIFKIIIICILVKTLNAKSVNKVGTNDNRQSDARFKRGYSNYPANDFGSSVHISSGVLQYSGSDEHSISSKSAVDVGHSSSLAINSLSADHSSSHLLAGASATDPWPESGISSAYDVWLEPLNESHTASDFDISSVHATSITSTHPGSDQIANTVFPNDLSHSAHFELPRSQLHTQISSSSIGNSAIEIGGSTHGQDSLAISDKIDFNNFDDANTKHYVKSYGK